LRALMLILDVVTRWSSSHQMMARSLIFQEAIDEYTAHDKNKLRQYRLSSADWDAIAIVERWLRLFRSATLQMSATKRPMLSLVHAIFRTLQQSLRESLSQLPNTCHPRLKAALIAAHRKLSDYYWKFDDESPFYLWASMLDPRIMYDGLLEDCTDEAGMTPADLERAKDALRAYLDKHYPARQEQSISQTATTSASAASEDDFTARYARKPRKVTDELEDLRLVGSAVAVERIFSGGRDTVGIRRASLSAETIRVLMVLKQALRKARDVIEIDD
ncbi:hypothetical protein EXIGLDRAFT_615677, partial [Exidia glandulosa HHB12029]